MPITTEYDEERGLITTRATGVLTPEALAAHQGLLQDDPRFDPDFDHVFDLSGVTRLEATSDQIRDIAAHRVFSHNSRRAVVAPRDAEFGMARMYGIFAGLTGTLPESNLTVVRSLEEALAWLDRPPL